MPTTDDYDALEARIEAGQVTVVPGTEARGADAAAAVQQFLMDATVTDSPEQAWQVLRGRPRLSPAPNEVVRVRIPTPLLDETRRLASRDHTTVSQIVRESLTRTVNESKLVN